MIMKGRKCFRCFAAFLSIYVVTGCTNYTRVMSLTGQNESTAIQVVYVTTDEELSLHFDMIEQEYKKYLCEEFNKRNVECYVFPPSYAVLDSTAQLSSDISKYSVSHIIKLDLISIDRVAVHGLVSDIRVDLYSVREGRIVYSAIINHQIYGIGRTAEASKQIVKSLEVRNFF